MINNIVKIKKLTNMNIFGVANATLTHPNYATAYPGFSEILYNISA